MAVIVYIYIYIQIHTHTHIYIYIYIYMYDNYKKSEMLLLKFGAHFSTNMALGSRCTSLPRFFSSLAPKISASAAVPPSTVLINGERVIGSKAKISVWDTTVQRGDGMFEVVRVCKDGSPLALDLHLQRLYDGAKALDYTIPATMNALSSWICEVAMEGGEGMVRVLLTRGALGGSGNHLPNFIIEEHAPPTVVVMWQPLPVWPSSMRLFPMAAWWHPAGSWQTVKWLSYGPNMMMSRTAMKAGYDDALLTSTEGVVLDGPTFAVGWFHNGVLHTPSSVGLGLLPSCTLELALSCANELGMKVNKGVFQLREMASADEVFVTSATKDVLPVSALGKRSFQAPGPMTLALANHFNKKFLN